MDADGIRRAMRQKLGDGVPLGHVTAERLAVLRREAVDADRLDAFAGLEPAFTFYGSNVTEWGPTVYWEAATAGADRDGACGDTVFQSNNVKSYGGDGSCANGKSRFWLSKLATTGR